ncbi:anthranilate synthase component II [Aestuariispira insulae]|uniref:Aminodeoxychorismate synthase glutamine amidotransferase subunit n=1 Tax=Aestuariispira insulae TaxID=1461337 RepID=A0A3D9HK94_9PROT|nr:aminodeoxychorismate/anthranilate synthase component II [Aestuariispira insulae]RED49691.1 aminodeoxychorismate synthase glutamine amidotransferase subunit [Aestuariispira insulae]
MILLIDNYDSFVYNLARYLEELGREIKVVRNDALCVDEIRDLAPEAIVISPGPCTPNEAGVSLEVIEKLGPHIPLLGVCLGHQAIGQVYGGKVSRAIKPLHGKTTEIDHNGTDLFEGLPNPLKVTRYHSLIVELEAGEAADLSVSARTDEGEIMAFRHKSYPVFGVQFHPEAVLTEGGHKILENFLRLACQIEDAA